jgi:hypothetical protein
MTDPMRGSGFRLLLIVVGCLLVGAASGGRLAPHC